MTQPTRKYSYGWKNSKPHAAPRLSIPLKAESELPTTYDMRPSFPACYDQGQLGSCTANASAGLVQRACMKADYEWKFEPSRLFIYYNSRAIEGNTLTDAGAELHDTCQAIVNLGVCPEVELDGTKPDWVWSYTDDQIKFRLKPSDACYKDAVLHKALKYQSVNLDRATVLNTLAADRPFMFGFTVYESFESDETAKTGIVSIPDTSTEQVLGGHATDIVGYILNTPMGTQGVKDWAILRNSWSTTWALDGYCYFPLDAMLCNSQMSSDAWTLDLIGYAK